MITKWRQYESVRDKMTGKSVEDIKSAISKLTPDERIAHITKYNLQDQYTQEELNEMFQRTATKVAGILMRDYEYYYEDNAYQWALSHMDEIMDFVVKGLPLSDVVYSIMMGREKDEQIDWEDDEMNEGLRDKMTPKSEEEIRKGMYGYFKENKVMNKMEYVKDTGVFEPDEDIYLVFDYEDIYDAVNAYFTDLVDGKESFSTKIYGDEYVCYPSMGVVEYLDDTLTSGWYFSVKLLDAVIDYIIEYETL